MTAYRDRGLWFGIAASVALAACNVDGRTGANDPVTKVAGALGTPQCLARPLIQARLQIILLLDDAAGSNCTTANPCISADDMVSFVQSANSTFSPAKLQFVYDKDLDFTTLVDADLNNNLDSGNGGGNWAHANSIAAGYPGKIVVFMRKVAGSNFAYPPDTGQAVPLDAPFPTLQPNFVAHDGGRNLAFGNFQNFSHELGHFVGLYHTQLTWGNSIGSCPSFDSSGNDTCTLTDVNNQIIALQGARGVGALDGDLLSDTPEDPGPYYWRKQGVDPNDPAFPSFTVNGVTYTPDRQNVMSYFGGFHLSAGQLAMVQNSMCDPSRASLISAPIARCQASQVVVPANAACTGSVTPQMIDAGSTDPNGLPLTFSLDKSGPFPVNVPQTVKLTVSNGTYSTPCTATVLVTDQTKPTITAPPPVSVNQCAAVGSVNVGTPVATDNCAQPPSVQGFVTQVNGVTLTTPIPVSPGGLANLSPGTNTIRWTASDGPNVSDPAFQTVTVRSGIQTSQSFSVDDRAAVRLPSGTPAGVLNSGTGTTLVAHDAVSGGILSVGPVQVLDRAHIGGDITTGATASVSATAVVAGVVTQHAQVVLPGLPALPAFPAPTGGSLNVNSGTTRNLAAGSYDTVNVNSNGTLVLGAGNYFFRSLAINASSIVRATAATRLYVQNNLAYQSPIRAPSGNAVQAVFLGFAGATTTIEETFNGTFVAPNASVAFGIDTSRTYTGAFYARSIELRPQMTMVCLDTAAAPL